MSKFLFAANWKMYQSFDQALQFVKTNKDALIQLGQSNQIAICPSFIALYPLIQELKHSIQIGAQDCSAFESGPYTGQIPATSLKEIGCTYCIIGHSERREYNHETNQEIADKAKQLLQHELQPIICIGESIQQYENKETKAVLTAQLKPIFNVLEQSNFKKTIYIAYEPVWAIGSGRTPEKGYLEDIAGWLGEQCKTQAPQLSMAIMYGGSVGPENAKSLREITGIDGFLIGSASLDFQKLKKIVS